MSNKYKRWRKEDKKALIKKVESAILLMKKNTRLAELNDMREELRKELKTVKDEMESIGVDFSINKETDMKKVQEQFLAFGKKISADESIQNRFKYLLIKGLDIEQKLAYVNREGDSTANALRVLYKRIYEQDIDDAIAEHFEE